MSMHAADGTPRLAFQQVPAMTPATWPDHTVPQQLHLDLAVESVTEPLRVYADRDDRPFCVFVA